MIINNKILSAHIRLSTEASYFILILTHEIQINI